MLKIEHVHQAFRSGFWLKKIPILQDISFNVPEGSITGFLGPNGSGKTSLIHLITGIRRPRAGTITWKGRSVREAEARSKLGYLPERPYFYEHLTGQQILRYFGRLSGLTDRQIIDRSPKILSRVGLAHARNIELKSYSKGMLQRIGIAQAILHDPELLILDEPMSGLDPLGRRELRELILEFGREGRTIFFSTHIVPDVEVLCDYVALIQKGRLLRQGHLKELLKTTQQEFELVFANTTLESLRSKFNDSKAIQEIRETPEGWIHLKIQDRPETVSRAIHQATGDGATLLQLLPRQNSLEECFN